jgi:hypothetical protein
MRAPHSNRRRNVGSGQARSPQEAEALKSAIERLTAQAESLGLLDPLDVEPVLIYEPQEHPR